MALAVALAMPAAPAPAQDVERAFVALIVNQAPHGDIVVRLTGTDVLVRVSDLARAGVRFGGVRHADGADVYVSLRSLAPDVTFDLDEVTLTLRITAQPDLLSTTVLSLRPARPPDLVYAQNVSAFVNLAATVTDFTTYSGVAELGVSVWDTLLFSSLFQGPDGRVVRGLSSVTHDERRALRRWAVGDRFASGGTLGGSVLLGGFSLSREFELDPYFYRFPSVQLAGALLTPSTAEVYVNNRLVRRETLPPGQFELQNVPVQSGSGVTRVVIRDAFGREQIVSSPYYFTAALLSPGLHEYNYHLGARRERFGIESWDYREPAFLARHRMGVTESLTAGGRLELSPELASGGPTMTARVPFGEVEVSAAASIGGRGPGAAISLGYTYAGQQVGFGCVIRLLTDRYTALGLTAADDRAVFDTNAFVAIPLGARTTATVQHTYADFRDRSFEQRVSAFVNHTLSRRLGMFVEASYTRQGSSRPVTGVFAGLSYFFDNGTTVNVSHDQRDGTGTSSLEVQKSRPVGPGLGYRAAVTTSGEQTRGAGLLQYESPYGRIEAGYERTRERGTSTLSVATGLVAIDGRVFATRPVQDSFALVSVPGVDGVRAYINNQEVGRTNRDGHVLVPALLPHYGNRVGISDLDIPLDYIVEARERTIAPPSRGGAVVRFPVRRFQAVSGTLVLETNGQTIIPAHGDVTVTVGDQSFESPIGRDGEFYLENVPAGTHPVTITHSVGACRTTLAIPSSPAPSLELGALRCVLR